MDTCICMAESLHCSPATITTFFANRLSVQFSCSVVSDSVTPMDCSMPAFPAHHQLTEFTQKLKYSCLENPMDGGAR